jgi:UDP-N-acetylmuramoyl-L-alanyl-D-glutamate--2,6-diaminopimelate ligase
VIIVPDSDEALRKLAVYFYGNPAKDMRIVGITGTKGKTTVALSVYNIASAFGLPIGYIGTNGVYYNGQVYETANTTPDCLELQKILREMKDGGITTVVLEVSSQALWQKRVYGIEFEICAFTNLYKDHIGGVEHPTMEHYMACKKLLFSDYGAKCIVVNSDSEHYKYMLESAKCEEVLTVSSGGCEEASLFAKNVIKFKNGVLPGISFELFSGNHSPISLDEHGIDVFVPIPGIYSAENALLTLAICYKLRICVDFAVDQLSRLRIPGRFEAIRLESRSNSLFIIDYAHNGASLTAVLKALREYEPKRIICLFGSVGGRTFGRRVELGEAARDYADISIITSDNPDTEDPMNVIKDIYKVYDSSEKEVYLIPDRKKAVEKAVELAKDGDFILLAGKGHESYQLISGRRIPFSEKDILRKADRFNLVY